MTRGLKETSLLTSYADHVVWEVWGDMIHDVVKGSSLFPLTTCSYQTIDKGLLLAFAERWHREKNTFHLLMGEMTITLDDVASLLDIPITSVFYNCEHMDKEATIPVLVELLRFEYKYSFDDGLVNISRARGGTRGGCHRGGH
ncbi:Protein MAIN-LIKE 1 [Glycine soja]